MTGLITYATAKTLFRASACILLAAVAASWFFLIEFFSHILARYSYDSFYLGVLLLLVFFLSFLVAVAVFLNSIRNSRYYRLICSLVFMICGAGSFWFAMNSIDRLANTFSL